MPPFPVNKFAALDDFNVIPDYDAPYIRIDPDKSSAWPEWADEMDGGYTETWSETDKETSRCFRIPYTKRAEFRAYMLGYSRVIPNPQFNNGNPAIDQPGTGIISHVIPAQDPEYPFLYCIQCSLLNNESGKAGRRRLYQADELDQNGLPNNPEPEELTKMRDKLTFNIDDNATSTLDGTATMRCVYRPKAYRIETDANATGLVFKYGNGLAFSREMTRLLERRISYAVTALPLARVQAQAVTKLKFWNPGGAFDGDDIPEPGVQLIPTAEMQYVWWTPGYSPTIFSNLSGKINDQPFDGYDGWPLFSAKTLLFQAPIVEEQERTIRGHRFFKITMRASYRQQTWWNFPAPDGSQLPATWGHTDPALAGSTSVYTPGDFSKVFTQIDYIAPRIPPA